MKKVFLAVMCSVFFFSHIFLSAQDEALGGYSIGLNIGIPVVKGAYLDGQSGTNLGLIVGTPHGLPLGPLSLGGGVGVTVGGAIAIPLEKFNIDLPLTIKNYGRGNAMNDAGTDSNIEGEPTGWINFGTQIAYNI